MAISTLNISHGARTSRTQFVLSAACLFQDESTGIVLLTTGTRRKQLKSMTGPPDDHAPLARVLHCTNKPLPWNRNVHVKNCSYRKRHTRGFSLLEILIALSIVGILAGISVVSYHIYINRAKSLEGEIALAEVNRLETLYYHAHSEYSSNFKDIGYSPIPPLKYYDVTVQLIGNGGEMTYRAIATPKVSQTTDVIVSTRKADGSNSLEKMPALPLSVSSGNQVNSDNSTDSTNSTAAGPQSSGSNATAPPHPSSTPIDPTVMKGGKAGD